MSGPSVLPLGEAALVVRLGDIASVELAARAAALARAIRAAAIDGVREAVPAVASVAVYWDPGVARGEAVTASVRTLVARVADAPLDTAAFCTHDIPTQYGGPDLDDVAERLSMSREEVIARHTAREYHVMALGFLPGWAYLGTLDPALALPRRATPRTRVPAGSVAIMGSQTGIYPRVSPGGWHLIGTTDVPLFDVTRASPALFTPGDRVRFVPVP